MTSRTKLTFPQEYLHHRYSLIHFGFFIQTAKLAKIELELVESNDKIFIHNEHLVFSCMLNDQQIIVDYADHSARNWQVDYPDLPYFKFQSNMPLPAGCIPLGPPMIGVKKKGTKGSTMRDYLNLREGYNFEPGTRVLCKQLPNGAAVERRNHVHQLLIENFNDVDVSSDNDQIDFWRMHEQCLTSVCVPGATNNMVDRGHMELVGLGVCTISPELHTVFPWNQILEPNKHYIKCQDDYSDLIDIVKYLEKNPSVAKQIGSEARHFYDNYYNPRKYWQWIQENLND